MILRVRPIDAHLTHNTDFLGKMDPYVIIYYGGQKLLSSVHIAGGKNPQWADILQFQVTPDRQMTFEVWDKNKKVDDFVAQGHENITDVLFKSGNYTKKIPLMYNGKDAGFLNVAFSS